MEIAVSIIQAILSVALIAVVLLQSGKEAGLSGALAGNASDSYLSKNKNGSLDKILSKSTKWIALVWALATVCLSLI